MKFTTTVLSLLAAASAVDAFDLVRGGLDTTVDAVTTTANAAADATVDTATATLDSAANVGESNASLSGAVDTVQGTADAALDATVDGGPIVVDSVVTATNNEIAAQLGIDICGLGLIDELCPGVDIDTSVQNWGNLSERGVEGYVVAGLGITGKCIIEFGPKADAVEKLIPKNKDLGICLDKPLLSAESVCDRLCLLEPTLGVCLEHLVDDILNSNLVSGLAASADGLVGKVLDSALDTVEAILEVPEGTESVKLVYIQSDISTKGDVDTAFIEIGAVGIEVESFTALEWDDVGHGMVKVGEKGGIKWTCQGISKITQTLLMTFDVPKKYFENENKLVLKVHAEVELDDALSIKVDAFLASFVGSGSESDGESSLCLKNVALDVADDVVTVRQNPEDDKTQAPETAAPTLAPTAAPLTPAPTPAPTHGSTSGDPHFKTWSGEKYDYHGECDLVLLDAPAFDGGKGLRVHIRTTRVKYFSYVEKAAIQIGNDVLEFQNDVENFLINGQQVEANKAGQKTMFGGYVVRREKKFISIRLNNEAKAKIDLIQRKNGFPAVVVDAGSTDMFENSLGLLGEWKTGRKLARDGLTEIEVDPEDGEAFALEWQVRDDEPMLFKDARFPQFPQTCTPAMKMPKKRLGMDKARAEAEAACAHWTEDKEDCIFDVMATRDVFVAKEGNVVDME